MIGIIAHIPVQEGKNAEFEAVFARLIEQVRSNEVGTLSYHLVRDQTDSQKYKVMELYTDQAAIDVHNSTDWFKAAMPGLQPCLAGAPKIEQFDVVI